MKRKLALALMLVLMLLMLVPFEALAQETVDTGVDYRFGLPDTVAHSSFTAEGRLWVFFRISTTIYYRSSPDDGATWSTPRTSTGYSVGERAGWDIHFDGTYGHLAVIKAADTKLYYRGFNPNPDGTITWGTESAALSGYLYSPSYYSVSISCDSNNYPYIAYTIQDGSYFARVYATGSTTGAMVWTSKAGAPWLVVTPGQYQTAGVGIYGLTGGKMVIIYNHQRNLYGLTFYSLTAIRYDGANWLGAASGTSRVYGRTDHSWIGGFAGVARDDYVDLVFLTYSALNIVHTQYSYPTNTFSAETTLYTNTVNDSVLPIISRSTDNNDLHVFWTGAPDHDCLYYAKYVYDTSTWVSYWEVVEDTTEHMPTYRHDMITQDELNTSSELGVYYMTDSTILKFKLLDEVFHVDTLDASPIGATTATLRGEIVSLGFGSATERGFWINDTPSLSGATQEGNETGTFNVGVFTHGITGLTEGDKYYYCAYASNAYGEAFGTWSQFTAGGSAGGIAVLTLDPTDVGDFEATFNGNIVATGGGYLTIRGFQYGHSDTPTWLWDEGGNFTVGLFSHTITDLEADSIYYVRAIAGNGTDTDYGQWIGFITQQPSYVPGEGDTYADLITAPIPTTAPGGWIRPGKDYNGFPIISPLINTFADLGFGRSFFWFIIEVFCIIVLTLIGARFTKNLPITFGILLVLFLLPFIAFEYLDWWMLAPFLVVGGALCIKEGQFSWS